MAEIAIYFKIFGLAEDDKGAPAWGGAKVSLGKFAQGKEIPYSELVKKVSLPELLALIGLDKIGLSETDAEIITPEEYARDYGDEDEPPDDERKCRVCGCTQYNACLGGCYWVEDDLCSKCAGTEIGTALAGGVQP